MKVLIGYRSRYGATERYARWLADELGGEATVVDLRKAGGLRLQDYGLILLGSAIYAGSTPRGVTSFCERHRAVLTARPVGLFICCLYEGDKAQLQLDEAFPDWLSLHAFGRWALGGEIHLHALKALDRFLARRVAKVETDVSRVRRDALEPILARVAEIRGGR